MFRTWEQRDGEDVESFTKRFNEELDFLKSIPQVTVTYQTVSRERLTVVGMIGTEELIFHPQTGQLAGQKFTDLSAAEVAHRIEQREKALERQRLREGGQN